jgi:pyrroloquinoline quinone (PQQ) biosynthesis protein C
MTPYEALIHHTAKARDGLLAAPIIQRALTGAVTRELYIAFLTQAYHHVRHTVPLMMAVGSRLTPEYEWLRKEIVHYTEEEIGHEVWILNDIAAAGGNREQVVASEPAIERRNPIGFFGMVFVLEGTSIALALNAAQSIQTSISLPDRAFSYLRSHGKLDQEHIHHLAAIVNRLDAPADVQAIARCAEAMFWLYGNIFRSLDRAAA